MFSRRMMSLFLPALVLSVASFMPRTAQAQSDACHACCDSLLNVNIEIEPTVVLVNDVDIWNYQPVNVSDILSYNDIAFLNDFLNNNAIASYNEAELTYVFGEILSDNETVVGILGGCVCYLKH
jgi:hypothetical protein